MDIAQNRELIYNSFSREFEEVIGRLFQDEGFETKLKQPTRDRGRDIIAMKYAMGKPIVFYIECKRWGRAQSSDRINKSILVTTGYVTFSSAGIVRY